MVLWSNRHFNTVSWHKAVVSFISAIANNTNKTEHMHNEKKDEKEKLIANNAYTHTHTCRIIRQPKRMRENEFAGRKSTKYFMHLEK